MNDLAGKKKVFKKWVKILFILIVLAIAITASVVITNGINTMNKKSSVILYSYNIKQNSDYVVNLYDNSFISSPTLGKGEAYISDLIKNIEAKFSYSYSATKMIPLKYDYNVLAIINGKYQLNGDSEESKVWTKEFILKEPTVVELNDSNSFKINENVIIDYNYFNDVVSEFRKELKLSITSVLKVKMQVNIVANVEGKEVKETQEIYMDIPLNQQAFEIKENYKSNYSNTVFENDNNIELGRKRLTAGCLIILVDMLLFFNLYGIIFNIKKKNKYTVKLHKILKEYGEIIVEIVNPILEDDLNVILVKNFNEMVDLEEELRIPIMFYEKSGLYEGEFVIVHNNILYKYVLTNETKDLD